MKKPPATTLYCSFCNAMGDAEPVLTAMQCEHVTAQRGGKNALPLPFHRFKCGRCGYQEIHDRLPASKVERPAKAARADKPEKPEKPEKNERKAK